MVGLPHRGSSPERESVKKRAEPGGRPAQTDCRRRR